MPNKRKLQKPNWDTIKRGFHQKMEFKEIEFKGVIQLLNEVDDKRLAGAWNRSLGHQIPGDDFPEYGLVREEVKKIFKKYF